MGILQMRRGTAPCAAYHDGGPMKIRLAQRPSTLLLPMTLCFLAPVPTYAAPFKIDAVLMQKEQIRLDFADGTKHFVAMVRREGKATGQGPLAGASVVEYGRHDIVPGVGGDPSGYLVFALSEADIAYVKWNVRAVFVPGAEGRPVLLDNGVWEVVSGTGKYKGLQGAGTLHIKPVSASERNFILEGELVGGTP